MSAVIGRVVPNKFPSSFWGLIDVITLVQIEKQCDHLMVIMTKLQTASLEMNTSCS